MYLPLCWLQVWYWLPYQLAVFWLKRWTDAAARMPRLKASLPRERVTGAARVRVPFGSYAALTPLTPQEVDALEQAILEEYGAYNLYQYIDQTYDYGDLFGQIAQSEQQHVNALIRQAEKYGMIAPENPGLTDPPAFTSQEEACQAGVYAEQQDADLYDELMALTDKADLERVFTRLQTASLESHLPAFEACLAECQLAQ